MSQIPLEIRKIILHEIDAWVHMALISDAQAYAIRILYEEDIPQSAPQSTQGTRPAAVPPRPAVVPPKPQPSLMQTLLSEASIKIALYLGAFFVIAAALILAALVETLRLPILAVVAAGFGVGALALKQRLPQPSFILWLVFSALLPINASVVAGNLELSGKAHTAFWVAVLLGMAVLWSVSTWFYRSRFFSLAAFAATGTALGVAVSLADHPTDEAYYLALTVAAFVGLGAAWGLKRWQGISFAIPLFVLANLAQLFILLTAFLACLIHPGLPGPSNTWWLVMALLWLLSAIFFVVSDLLVPFELFSFLAAGSLALLPWFVIVQFQIQNPAESIAWWVWAAVFALAGEALNLVNDPRVRWYSLALSLGALGLGGLGAISGWLSAIGTGFMLFLMSALLFVAMQVINRRWWVWSAALFFALVAYFLYFQLPGLEALAGYSVYQSLGAALLLLLPDLFLQPDLNAAKAWRWPLRILGAVVLLVSLAGAPLAGIDHPLQALVAFGLAGLYFLGFALVYKRVESQYLFTGSLAVAFIYGLRVAGLDFWLWPLIGVTLAYYLSGWALRGVAPRWAATFEASGLALGTVTAFSAPFENSGLGASLPVVAVATLWAVEAFRRRNTWLAFPANGLYLMAYYMILVRLHVTEPQFFSIGAALLGIIMHYLLVRSGSQVGAFLIGTASQVVLLGTTYIQMAASQDLSFFMALFLQSMVVMVYGLVIRSRSLTFAPIGIVCLGVATVVFSVLRGISTVILVGGTGMLMILLGILAVFMRESLTKVSSFMTDWIS